MSSVLLHFRAFPSSTETCKVSNLLSRKLTQTLPGLASRPGPVDPSGQGGPMGVWPGWQIVFTENRIFMLPAPHITLPLKSHHYSFHQTQVPQASVLKVSAMDFPGGPVIKTLGSQSRDSGLIHDLGTRILHAT